MRSNIVAALMVCGTSTQAAVVSGDFSDGLNGYTLDVCGLTCGRPTDPFFDIQFNGLNAYLEVNTGTSLLGVTEASASMDIAITADTRFLSFDAIWLDSRTDPGSTGTGGFFEDALSTLLIDESSNYHFLFNILHDGFAFNPFANPNVDVSQTAASDPFFGPGVLSDLGAFEGQSLSLGIFAFSESDGMTLFGGFDNFTLSTEPISPVPVPPSLPLLAGAFALLGFARGRRNA